jgi:hypothetical protein
MGMKTRFGAALAIGILTQVLALCGYTWLAKAYPDGIIKYAAFVLLVAGSAWAVWSLAILPKVQALGALFILAIMAPVVPLIRFGSVQETLSAPWGYSPFLLRGFAAALLSYLVAWAVCLLMRRRRA